MVNECKCDLCGDLISHRSITIHLKFKHNKDESYYWENLVDKEIIKSIIDDYLIGFCFSDLSEKYYISSSYIRRIFRFFKVKKRSNSESKRTEKYINRYKSTCILRYGVDNVSKSDIIKAKKMETSLINNGYINNFCNKEIQSRAQNIRSLSNHIDIYEKTKNTMIERYGVENPGQLESSKETQRKRMKDMIENGTFPDNSFFKKINFVSKLEIKIQNILNYTGIEYICNTRIDKKHVDIYIERYNLIIEINGDYWHANPEVYKPNDIIYHKKGNPVIASDVWEKEKRKIDYLSDKGYNIQILWEKDINVAEKEGILENFIINLLNGYEDDKNSKDRKDFE